MKLTKRKIIITSVIFIVLVSAAVYILYVLNFIGHSEYSNADFEIEPYVSTVDKDGDGVDDQTDILQSAREYISTRPKYKSEYYDTGYPTGNYGVCTDLVAISMKNSGYDLMLLVNEDIIKHPDDYDIEEPDINIDFRRVKNLKVYFEHTAQSLTTDLSHIEQWQGGDIIIFTDHIGIVSDKRNSKGMPYIIHHAYPGQPSYEEDVFGGAVGFYNDIFGHYRVS